MSRYDCHALAVEDGINVVAYFSEESPCPAATRCRQMDIFPLVIIEDGTAYDFAIFLYADTTKGRTENNSNLAPYEFRYSGVSDYFDSQDKNPILYLQ